MILERVSVDVLAKIRGAVSIADIEAVFKEIFSIGQSASPGNHKDPKSDFGLKVRGIKARENLNAMAREILERVHDPDDLTDEDRQVLEQYSGRGGLSENSQFEYYTPTGVAQGIWDALALNGFANGNVLDPCVGAGVFPATKPKGTIITGCDIDPTGSKIASLLNPEDGIRTGSFEALATSTPDNSFDAVTGNVPFGDARGASMHDDPAYKSEKRIERYFILRALDKVKPGGLCCLVVPINIVGAKGGKWERFRIEVSKKAEFLGAHKLPSKTFKTQGTDTVVDIIVLKKHPQDLLERIDDISFDTLKTANVIWDEFVQGRYWMGEGKRFIQGKWVPKVEGERWSREIVDGDIDSVAIRQKLAVRFDSRIDWDMIESAPAEPKSYIDGDRRVINGRQYEMQDGQWVAVVETAPDDMAIDAGKYGVAKLSDLKAVFDSPDGPLRLSADQAFAAFNAWPDLLSPLHRDAVEFAMSQPSDKFREQAFRGTIIGGLLGRLQADPNDIERERLQNMVTAEIERFGHPKGNKIVVTGESSRAFGLFLNAVDEKGTFSDLLAGTMTDDRMQFNSSDVQSIVEHLFIREGIRDIGLEDVQKLYTGGMKIESLGDLAAVENIALTPDGLIMPLGRYCSGDVYPKIVAMTDAMADEEDDRIRAKYQAQIDYIKSRLKLTRPEDIYIGMQEKWFPKEYLVQYLRENGYPGLSYGRYEKVPVEDSVSGKTTLKNRWVEDFDSPFGEFVGIDKKRGGFQKQFLKYLNGGKVTSSGENAQERIEAYKQEVNAITENFNAWMQQHPDMDRIAKEYNHKFNAFIPYDYETTPLEIEGFTGDKKPHGYQSAAIRRMSEEGRGILGLDTGLGKTLSAIGLHLYNKQMGRTKKTCIVVPNSVLSNWYVSCDKMITDMNDVLFVGVEPERDKEGNVVRKPVLDENGKPKTRANGEPVTQPVLVNRNSPEDIWEKMWEIPTTGKSLVVMTTKKFGIIPMKRETKAGFAQKMGERALISEKMVAALSGGGKEGEAERKITYKDDKDRLRNEGKFADEGTRKKGELPFFEDMGFTSIIADEFHQFKNSFKGGEQTSQIAYLPTASNSKRALDMTMKCSYLCEANDGRGVYGLTATPVTNSPMEIFNMLSYVAPMGEFERFGVYTVDDFVRVFGRIETVDKVMVSGEVKSKDGLVGFRNLDGLRNLFHKYTLLKTAEDVGLELPPHNETNEEVELSALQNDIYTTLKDDAKDAATPGSKTSMFSVIRQMDRITTDIDLYNRKMTFVFRVEDREKVDALAKELPSMVDGWEENEKGKQEKVKVPCVPEFKVDGKNYIMVVPEMAEEHVSAKLKRHGIDENHVTHPLMPKYAKLVENVRKHIESNGKQIVFTEEKSQHQKLKRILSHHIPLARDLIGIINADEAAGDKIQQISDAYNSGQVKIVIANKKAEVGVNLQKGTTAIHHLTLPWTPASIQQRNGRGVRQGNTAEHIDIYYYMGKGSFDFYRLDILKRKSNWMHDLFNGDATEAENANAMGQDDMLDLLADDPEEAKRRRMERLAKQKAEREERERRRMINLLQQLTNVTEALEKLDDAKTVRKAKLEEKIPKLEKQIAEIKAAGAEMEPGEAKKALAEQLEKKKRELASSKSHLETLDADFAKKRQDLESKQKQSQSVLKMKANKGELPFDAALIDNPKNAVAGLDGTLYAVGETYEYRRGGSPVGVYRITRTFSDPKAVVFETVVEYSYFRINTDLIDDKETDKKVRGALLSQKMFSDMVKVAYSEKELALKRLLATSHEYVDLFGGEIDKETFAEHILEITLKGYGLIRTDGGFAFDYMGGENAPKVVFPEPTSESYRKALAETYLDGKRKDTIGTRQWNFNQIMKACFGDDFHEAVLEYGKKATEADIRAFFADFVKTWMDENIPGGSGNPDYLQFHHRYADLFYFLRDEVKSLGDNKDEIVAMAREVFDEAKVEWEKKAAAALDAKQRAEDEARAERERLENERLRADPNFKEVPENVVKAFAQIGIEIRINKTNIVLPGGKKRYGGGRWPDKSYPPFARWFFQDRHGKSGILIKAKDTLKDRFKAQYYFGESGDYRGAWWHIDSAKSLSEIYKVII